MNRKELKELSKSQLKGNWKVPVLLMLAYCVVLIVLSIMQNSCDSGFAILIGLLVSLGIETWAFVGLPNFFLKFSKQQNSVSFKDVLVSKNILLKSLGVTVLISIIGVIVGVIIGFSIVASTVSMVFDYETIGATFWIAIILCIALSIGLTIFSLAIAMTAYILVDKEELGVFKAIGLSIKMMKGHKWELFVIQLSFIGWGILCILTLGIGYLWLAPYMSLTMVNFYKTLNVNFIN